MPRDDEIALVVARLENLPPNLKLAIGQYGAFDKAGLLREIKSRSEVGTLVVDMQMNYLRSLKTR